ncbi:MAG: lytic transglycosylase domain-containing protein [Synergistaceae bacterium]|nr:lytic transglycosylase domain-containing protein [Synergistaceae bacterium]
MRKTANLRKFLFALLLVLIVACVAEANSLKADNIANLFTRVNPSLGAKTAQNYASIIVEACEKFSQDPYVIAALVVHESTVNNKAVSKGGDYGLMQIRWKIHSKAIKQRFPKVKKANDLFDARTNIFFGTEIFSDGMKKGGNFQSGVLRYSAGNKKLVNKVTKTVNELKSSEQSAKKKVTPKKKK